MKSRLNCALALLALCVAVAHAVRPVSEERIQVDKKDDDEDKKGPTTPFVAPLGFFIQASVGHEWRMSRVASLAVIHVAISPFPVFATTAHAAEFPPL